MTKPILVMVHGRAQGGLDAAVLRQQWIDTLVKGLPAGQAERLDEIDIRFPYYGDELDSLVEKALDFPPDVATRGDPKGVDPEYIAFRKAIAEAALEKAAADNPALLKELADDPAYAERGPLQWGWVQAILQKLEAVPGLSGRMLERFTRDVYIYLKYPIVRDTINEIVQKQLPASGQVFMLGHSLGSVVAYDVLRKASGIQVPLFATVGSPLGVREIVAWLKPIGFPGVAAKWFNAYDDRDVVALRPLDAVNFATNPPVENYGKVKNHTDNAHGIVGYLNDKVVAARIFEAITAAA